MTTESSGRPSIGLRIMIRRLRSDLPLAATVILVIVMTSASVAVAPRFFQKMSDDGLRSTIELAPTDVGNVSVRRTEKILQLSGDEPFAGVDRAGTEFFETEMPDSLVTAVEAQTLVVDSPRFQVMRLPGEPDPGFTAFVQFRHQSDVDAHIQLVAGSLPTPREPISVMLSDNQPPELLSVYEVAMSRSTLDRLEIDVGERLIVGPDPQDPRFTGAAHIPLESRIVIEISGVVAANDADEPYWYEDPALQRPSVVETPDFALIFATGLIAPIDYARLLSELGTSSWQYEWRYFINPSQLRISGVDELTDDLRNLEIQFPAVTNLGHDSLRTGLTRLTTRFLEQRQSAAALLSLISIGLLAVSLGTIGLLTALTTTRRRDSTYLLRSRGASSSQLLVLQVSEGIVLVAPASALGYLIAAVMVPEAGTFTLGAVVLAAAAASTTMVLVARSSIYDSLGSLVTDEPRPQQALRRKVFEITVILAAIASIVLLRRRGLADQSDSGAGLDPLIGASPTLLAIAVGLVTIRLYDVPIRAMAWLGSLRRGLVSFVGSRRVLQQPPAARMAVLVMLVAMALATFASTIRLSIEDGQQESTWQEVGADFRIAARTNVPIPLSLDLSDVASIESSAVAFLADTAIRSQTQGSDSVTLMAFESGPYQEVTSGTPADVRFPEELLETQTGPATGSRNSPIAALISQEVADERGLEAGEIFNVIVGVRDVAFYVVETRDRFPGVSTEAQFVVANLDSLEEHPRLTLRPTAVYLRAPASARGAIEEGMDGSASRSLLTSRSDTINAIRDAPLVSGIHTAFELALPFAIVIAAMAASSAFALTARSRSRDLAYLRTLGLARRQARLIAVVEQLPPLIIATSVGAALGVGVAFLAEPGINLSSFTGPGLAAELRIDLVAILLLVFAGIALVMLVVAVFSWVTRNQNVAGVLRLGGG